MSTKEGDLGMPNEGISVYFTIKDGASQVLKTIGDHTKALDKETQQLAP